MANRRLPSRLPMPDELIERPMSYPAPIEGPGYPLVVSESPRTTVHVNVPRQSSNSFGIGSLVLGIVGLAICWFPLVGLAISGVALLMSIVGVMAASGRRGTGMGFAVAGLTVSLLGTLLGLAMLTAFWQVMAIASKGRAGAVPVGSAAAEPETSEDPGGATWVNAARAAQLGDIRVDVGPCRISRVVVRQYGRQTLSEDELLVVPITLTNVNAKAKHDYDGWSGGGFSMSGNWATMKDDLGNGYDRITFGMDRPVGQIAGEALYPGKRVKDLLVFEPPIEAAESLYLTLPGAAVGESGDFRFRIPVSAIER